MWKCSCGTRNLTLGKRCHKCGTPKDVEGESLVLGCVSIFLIAFAAAMIGDVYQIPALKHYGVIALFLSMGFGGLSMARSDQKSGLGGDSYLNPIKKEESPIFFWFDITITYAAGIVFIVVAIIAFFAPNLLF